MKTLCFLLLLSGSFLFAQNTGHHPKSKDEVTVQGCVSRANGDYILMKQNPAVTYELQATGKIRLKNYLGQRVEITGTESPTLSSSSDAMNKVGSAAPVTLNIISIKTIDKECPVHQISEK